jgi:dolichyl-phosphooligosaccharide-protein glycotransferase
LALFLRVYPRIDAVFGGGWVRFGEVDPWYHLRLLENLLHHFPHNIVFDPYTSFPTGQPVFFAPFFDLFLGFFIWVIGLGSPTMHTMETVAAYFPAILGALTVIPVYFIGKELFNKQVGLISAALLAILPGNFLARSLLGLTDHHSAEVLLSSISVLFLILAIKSAKNNEITISSIFHKDWGRLKKPLIYTLWGGIFLGIYMTTWIGGLLFVFFIFVYFLVQNVLDFLKGQSTDYLGIIGCIVFVIALVIIIPFLGFGGMRLVQPVSLAFGTGAFISLSGLSRLMERRGIKRFYYPLSLIGVLIVATLIIYAISPGLLRSMLTRFDIYYPQGGSMTITEVKPLFSGFSISSLTHSMVWQFFSTGLFFVPLSIILIVYSAFKDLKAEMLLFLVWSVLMLVTMLAQNRFSYYFTVNVALMGGFFCWKIAGWIPRLFALLGYTDDNLKTISSGLKKKKGKSGKKSEQLSYTTKFIKVKYVSLALAAVIGFMGVFYPNISLAMKVIRVDTGPDEDWHESLLWMKDNTPDPFQNPDFYYELYRTPDAVAPNSYLQYPYPESAYGVMSAWDYGHWITQIAHRIPNANPHQYGATDAAFYFTSQNESSANKVLNRLGSRYVIIDKDMAVSMFFNHSEWLGESETRYREVYYKKNPLNKYETLMFYYPEYYRSISSRLYNFGGEAVVPDNTTWVVTFEERRDSRGTKFKEVTQTKVFPTYEEADLYCQNNSNCRIVGLDPFVSPVPLKKLNNYQLVHKSETIINETDDSTISYVEIFEYTP